MKTKHKHEVSVDEYNIAFVRWKECKPKSTQIWTWRHFLVGGWHFNVDATTVTFHSEKAVTKIKMMNSPHYKALFKAMVIQDENS